MKAQFYFTLDITDHPGIAQQVLNVPKIASAQFVSNAYISHVECIQTVDALCEKLAQQVDRPKTHKWVKLLNPLHIEPVDNDIDTDVWKPNISIKIFYADIAELEKSIIRAPLVVTIYVNADPEIVLH